MTVESAADRLAFLSDFGQSCTYTKQAGGASTVLAIFDNDYFAAEAGASVAFVSAQPRLVLRSSELPSGADFGDTVAVDGVNYTVRVIQPDGTGMTTLLLEKA